MTAHQLPASGRRTLRRVAESDFSLIVHSHLRWDFVWQRPQQLLSRMATVSPVLFVEEPVYLDDVGAARLDVTTPQPNLYRVVPRLPASLRESYDDGMRAVRDLLQSMLADGVMEGIFVNPVQWFYTPMPAPVMLGAFNERGVVYDCMDELAKFRFAPTDLSAREAMLLANADVVFTGGHKLFQSKSRFHDNVHFFGCGVDARHFAEARKDETPLPADIRDLPRPIFGYYGVIDERLDYELIGRFAEACPDGSLVMVGPVVKVDPNELPRAANIHWLGQRSYEDLPAYVKSFDVCLMPFALNEATEYINPTKTLEYMAAGKPIVSTPVADVVHNFTPIVRVAASAVEFVAAARESAESPDLGILADGVVRAQGASWDSIVQRMRQLIASTIAQPAESLQDVPRADESDAAWRARHRTTTGLVRAVREIGA